MCATFGVRVGAKTSGNFGVNYGVKLNSGSLDLRYPIAAAFTVPDPGAVLAGSDFTIGSSWAARPDGDVYVVPNGNGGLEFRTLPSPTLQTHGPQVEAFVDLVVQFHAFAVPRPVPAYASAWCSGRSTSTPGTSWWRSIGVATARFALAALRSVPTETSAPHQPRHRAPAGAQPRRHRRGSGRQRQPQHREDFHRRRRECQLAQIAAKAVGFPLPLQGNSNGFGYNLLQANAGVALEVAQTLDFAPVPQATLQFSEPVQQRFSNGSYGAPTTTISFCAGRFGHVEAALSGGAGRVPDAIPRQHR